MTSIGQVLNPERETGISLCHHHSNNEVVYTCNDCDGMMACAECVTSTHQGHSLYKLRDTATYVWENLVSSYISKAEKLEIPKVITEMKIADGRIQANKKHFQELVAEIQYRGEILKNEVDKITMKLVESVTQAAKENAECLRSYKKELDELHADTLYIVRKCKQAEESGEYKVVFEFEKEIRSGLKLPRVPITQTTSFLGRSMLETKQDVEDIFGSVTIIGKKKPQTLLERKKAPKSAKANRSNLVSEFRHLSEITSMLPTPENTWVSNSDSKDIVLIDHTGEEKQKIELDIHVNDICISPDTGNIWFSSGYDYSIRELTSHTSAEVRFCISSVPLALCITPDHRIAVATFRRVSIHNKEGVEMFATKAGKDGGQQIASPRHIRSCPLSGNIAVADWDERSHGGKGKPCITVLNSSLQTLFRFHKNLLTNGNKNSNALGKCSFLPYDVCYDTAGTLFVADHSSKSIMMVSSRGEFLATMYTDQEFGPQTLGIQPGNLLWTGFSYGIVKVLKYKI